MTHLINKKHLLILLLFYSAIALLFAYIGQWFFDLHPCKLCFYQRIPFFLVIATAIFALRFSKQDYHQKMAVLFCVIILSVNAAIALFHVGVEQKIFKEPGCVDQSLEKIDDLQQLKEAILLTKAVRCDEPAFVFLGISMAGWNAIYCLFMVLATVILLQRIARHHTELQPSSNS